MPLVPATSVPLYATQHGWSLVCVPRASTAGELPPATVVLTPTPRGVRLCAIGEFDIATEETLEEAFEVAMSMLATAGPGGRFTPGDTVILDCARVRFFAVSTVGVLVRAASVLYGASIDLELWHVGPSLHRLLDVLGRCDLLVGEGPPDPVSGRRRRQCGHRREPTGRSLVALVGDDVLGEQVQQSAGRRRDGARGPRQHELGGRRVGDASLGDRRPP